MSENGSQSCSQSNYRSTSGRNGLLFSYHLTRGCFARSTWRSFITARSCAPLSASVAAGPSARCAARSGAALMSSSSASGLGIYPGAHWPLAAQLRGLLPCSPDTDRQTHRGEEEEERRKKRRCCWMRDMRWCQLRTEMRWAVFIQGGKNTRKGKKH